MKAEGAAAFHTGKRREACPPFPEGQKRFTAWWQDGWDEAAAAAKTTRVPGARAQAGVVASYETDVSVRWSVTSELRWYAPDDAYSAGEPVLQQLHQGSDGSQEWVAVPIVKTEADVHRGQK